LPEPIATTDRDGGQGRDDAWANRIR